MGCVIPPTEQEDPPRPPTPDIHVSFLPGYPVTVVSLHIRCPPLPKGERGSSSLEFLTGLLRLHALFLRPLTRPRVLLRFSFLVVEQPHAQTRPLEVVPVLQCLLHPLKSRPRLPVNSVLRPHILSDLQPLVGTTRVVVGCLSPRVLLVHCDTHLLPVLRQLPVMTVLFRQVPGLVHLPYVDPLRRVFPLPRRDSDLQAIVEPLPPPPIIPQLLTLQLLFLHVPTHLHSQALLPVLLLP